MRLHLIRLSWPDGGRLRSPCTAVVDGLYQQSTNEPDTSWKKRINLSLKVGSYTTPLDTSKVNRSLKLGGPIGPHLIRVGV